MAAPDWPGWRKGFYLPTSSDAGVVVMRKWLEQVAGESLWQGQPPRAQGTGQITLFLCGPWAGSQAHDSQQLARGANRHDGASREGG